MSDKRERSYQVTELLDSRLAYPREYFHAQVQFAKKWSLITGAPLIDCLQEQTALYRRIVNARPGEVLDPLWGNAMQQISDTQSADEISHMLFNVYAQQPHSRYEEEPSENEEHFGPFTYEYHPEAYTVFWHFKNTDSRQGSPFANERIDETTVYFITMFRAIRQLHPEATTVIDWSWLNSKKSLQRILPQEIVDEFRRLGPPELKFTGDPLWGQFVSGTNTINERVYQKFIENVQNAQTKDDLLNAFPYPVLYTNKPIDVYYKAYAIT